jgi:uncharacterized protein YjbI with pentapeptide repeats
MGMFAPSNGERSEELRKLIHLKDGMWRGFDFPGGLRLTASKYDFQIDLSHALIEGTSFDDVEFLEDVRLDSAVFKEKLSIQKATFHKQVQFDKCKFEGPVDVLHAKFMQPYFTKRVNFNNTIFHRAVKFSGWRNISLSPASGVIGLSATGILTVSGESPPTLRQRLMALWRRSKKFVEKARTRLKDVVFKMCASISSSVSSFKRRYSRTNPNEEVFDVFGDTGDFEFVDFAIPSHVVFQTANLSKVYFRGTNLRGARFYAVNWYQPELKRNGLYDELNIQGSSDGAFRYQNLPILEETCRNLRAALEDNRNYAEAADFYVGEMEARRMRLNFLRRYFFSVEALYRYASTYGTSVGRALTILVAILLLHTALNVCTQTEVLAFSFSDIEFNLYRSIQLPFIQPDRDNVTAVQRWLDLVFRMLAIIQIALVVFAFRTRIKRH